MSTRIDLKPITRKTHKTYNGHVTNEDTGADIDITGATIEFSIKKDPLSPDYQIHKSTGVATKASVSILSADAQLDYEAGDTGVEGNDIAIQYVDPGENDAVLSAVYQEDIVGDQRQKNIIVSLATDAGGIITSTANEVKAIIEAITEVAAGLFTITVPGTGADVVTAVAQTFLTGGISGGITITTAAEGKFQIKITDDETFAVLAGAYCWDNIIILPATSERKEIGYGNVQFLDNVTE